jgi:uncharacterized membrane protein YcaP (DUF421 family)
MCINKLGIAMNKKQKDTKWIERRVVIAFTILYTIGCWYILFMSFHDFNLFENFLAILALGIVILLTAWISLKVLKIL